jgi:hypothetical protein
MEESQKSRRIRPSLASFGAAWVFLGLTIYLTSVLVEELLLAAVIVVALLLGLGVCFYRVRGLASRLPEPFGKGLVSEVSLRRTTIQGALLVAVGALVLMVPFMALYFFPGAVVIMGVLTLMGGLAASELLTFFWVSRLERITKGNILQITELSENEGKQVLLKSVELQPRESREPREHRTWPPVKPVQPPK